MNRLPKVVERQIFNRALARTEGVEMTPTAAQKDGKTVSLLLGRGDIDRRNMKRILSGLNIQNINL